MSHQQSRKNNTHKKLSSINRVVTSRTCKTYKIFFINHVIARLLYKIDNFFKFQNLIAT